MKKTWMMVVVFLMFTGWAVAQSCDQVVLDGAGVLGDKMGQVVAGANDLINQGADVRVITVASTSNLDISEKDFEKTCPSWQSADGGRKNTLIVLAVAPKDRKLGIYYGGAWHFALDNDWNRIKTDYMAPRFRDGDYAGGFIAAEQQLTGRLVASKSEAKTPVVATTTTINQEAPTDFSGLWKVLEWLLFIVLGSVGVWFAYFLLTKDKREKAKVSQAQQNALLTKNDAANLINSLSDKVKEEEAVIGNPTRESLRLKTVLGLQSERFSRLAGTLATNPETQGLTAEEYDNLNAKYQQVIDALNRAVEETTNKYKAKLVVGKEAQPFVKKAKGDGVTNDTTAVQETVAKKSESDNGGGIAVVPIPVVVEEPREEHHSHHHSDDDDSSSSSGGGGSSSWGSGGDSGGSSGFGSDFGGGGGSDFGGGGGDSGGGGSSGF